MRIVIEKNHTNRKAINNFIGFSLLPFHPLSLSNLFFDEKKMTADDVLREEGGSCVLYVKQDHTLLKMRIDG